MRYLVAFATVLCLYLPVQAEVVIEGSRKVKLNGYAELNVRGQDKAVFQVSPAPVQMSIRGGYLYFGGVPGVEYTVLALVVVIDFDARTWSLETGSAVIVFGEEGPAPPGPGPAPVPDEDAVIVATFTKTFQSAADLESAEDKALVPKLAEFYRESRNEVDNQTTWKGLFTKMSDIANAKGVAGRALVVQGAIQTKLKERLPWKQIDPNMPIDPEGKKKAKTLFTNIAKALEKVK